MTLTIFTSPTCVPCQYLKKYLTDKGYFYEVIDVSEDPIAFRIMQTNTNQNTVPSLRIRKGNTEHWVSGFQKGLIDELLKEQDDTEGNEN